MVLTHSLINSSERRQASLLAESSKNLKRPNAPLSSALSSAAVGAAAAGISSDPRPTKKAATGLKSTHTASAPQIPDEYLPPNKILFLQNLPDSISLDILDGIFGSFEGFKEVRLVPGRKGIAFVEYENEAGAISAKENTGGMTLGPEGSAVVKVTYQRQ